jgi:hypothetical protein
VTKVLNKKQARLQFAAALFSVVVSLASLASAQAAPDKPAENLYLQLQKVGLDPDQVYHVRGASLDRPSVSMTFEDGTIAFTKNVMGRITGAFFEGEGEILVTPPNDVERRSMSLFTGMAILEEHFATAYLRFNDDAVQELRSGLRVTENKQEFVQRWNPTAENLANADAIRLLMSLSKLLPLTGGASDAGTAVPVSSAKDEDRFLHARFQGTKLGVFDLFFDSAAAEQVQVGQAKNSEGGGEYYDLWTSFSPHDETRTQAQRDHPSPGNQRRLSAMAIRRYVISTEVRPPKQIHAKATLQLEVREGGARTLAFELSRFLNVESVKLHGQPVEFIHNPAVEGTQLSRRGNDVVAVILPKPAVAGQEIDIEFSYGGEVLAEAGSGLLYVGARGTWYPNRGLAMADFDLQFSYPPGWTLVATGKPTPASLAADGLQTSRWISERPIPVAGFNLGKYKVATTHAGNVTVETYASQGVERDFPSGSIQVVDPSPSSSTSRQRQIVVPTRPSPARNQATVGETAADAIQYYAARFGPYPYSRLALTQMPGLESQGWPSLVFLSSYAFLNKQDREQLHYGPLRALIQESVTAHETAHQWWGDLIGWSTYRDQWISEGLASYCALMMLQEKDPAGFRLVMDQYRKDLTEKNKDGMAPMDAGPVTLGLRLLSSHFPSGYEAINYGRGAWLFHMLRTMLNDAAAQEHGRRSSTAGDEPFVRGLRKLRERYEGRSVSTRELLDVFVEDLPAPLRYENQKSLDWFFDGWINGTALPKLELKAVKVTPKGASAVVTGTILQKSAPKDLVTSVPVYAVTSGKQLTLLGRVFADGEESSFRVSAPASTRKIVLDPNETVLTQPK